jgi:hypothetical protein
VDVPEVDMPVVDIPVVDVPAIVSRTRDKIGSELAGARCAPRGENEPAVTTMKYAVSGKRLMIKAP